jgi:hypothetical protein
MDILKKQKVKPITVSIIRKIQLNNYLKEILENDISQLSDCENHNNIKVCFNIIYFNIVVLSENNNKLNIKKILKKENITDLKIDNFINFMNRYNLFVVKIE